MIAMMKLGERGRKCRVALIAIADCYSMHRLPGSCREAPEPHCLMAQAFTLDVIDAITIDAILNCSVRLTMP